MANITATANFRKAQRAYKASCKIFLDFVHDNAREVWAMRKGYKVSPDIVENYKLLLVVIEHDKRLLDEAANNNNSKSQYRHLRVA